MIEEEEIQLGQVLDTNVMNSFFKKTTIDDHLEQMLEASERSNECQEPIS